MIPRPVHAFVPHEACRSLDGAGTRRRQLLGALGSLVPVETHVLSPRAPAGAGRRLGRWIGDLRALVRALHRIRSGTALLFYPDLPCFHPPGWAKLVGLALFHRALKELAGRPGCALWIDVVDLPRHQAPELGYRLRLPPAVLRRLEGLLFRAATRVTLPSPGLRDLLLRDLALPVPRCPILPNGARRSWMDGARRRPLDGTAETRFLYAGHLGRSSGRRIEGWVETFLRHGEGRSSLHLVGPEGAWIRDRFHDARLHVHDGRSDEAWMALSRTCHVGLMPYPETSYFSRCMPSKLAAYAAAGLRILATRLEESRRWIEDWKLGRCLAPEDFPRVYAAPAEFVRHVDEDGGPLPGWEEALSWEGRLAAFLA